MKAVTRTWENEIICIDVTPFKHTNNAPFWIKWIIWAYCSSWGLKGSGFWLECLFKWLFTFLWVFTPVLQEISYKETCFFCCRLLWWFSVYWALVFRHSGIQTAANYPTLLSFRLWSEQIFIVLLAAIRRSKTEWWQKTRETRIKSSEVNKAARGGGTQFTRYFSVTQKPP